MIPRAFEVVSLLAKTHSPHPGPGDVTVEDGGGLTNVAPVALVVFGVLLVVLVIYLSYAMKERRRAAFAQQAALLHLAYSRDDTLGILGYPFTLLHRGDGQGVENVVHGAWQEIAVIAFDFWYYDESTDANGHTSRSYHRFNCAIVPIDADCPRLAIGRETLLTSLAGALSFHDIEFESEDFNREFHVACEVPKFANDVIDQRMMAWLLATGSDHSYETLGNRVLVAGPRIDPVELPILLGAARGFVQHVPKVVASLYPG